MTNRELYKLLDELEKRILNTQLKALRRLLKRLDNYVKEGVLTKSYADKIRIDMAKELKNYVGDYKAALVDVTAKAYRAGVKTAYSDLDLAFSRMPTEALKWFNTKFVPSLGIYADNMGVTAIKTIQNFVALGIVNGESVFDITKNIKRVLRRQSFRQIQVVVRDQLGTAMQMGIWNTYKKHEDIIEGYRWMGPEDKRTTEYCHNRDMITLQKDWTVAQVNRYKRTNPKTLDGLEITAPGGTFLHPHIQCRHRLLAITK